MIQFLQYSVLVASLLLLFVYSIHLVMVSGYTKKLLQAMLELSWFDPNGCQWRSNESRRFCLFEISCLLNINREHDGALSLPTFSDRGFKQKSCVSKSGFSPFCTCLCLSFFFFLASFLQPPFRLDFHFIWLESSLPRGRSIYKYKYKYIHS